MQETYKMAGRLAAHAVSCVSTGELLIPIYGYLTADGETKMVRVVADNAQQAMEEGETMYGGNRYNAAGGLWVVDGFITVKDVGKVDALILNICTYEEPRRELRMAIPYRHAQSSQGFAVFTPKLIGLDNLETSELQPLMDAFFEGRDEYTEGAEIWAQHHEDEMTGATGFAGFDEEEWATVRDAPLVVFFMVAGADGKIDAKELKALESLFEESGKYPSVLMQRVMTELTPHAPLGQALVRDFYERYTGGGFFTPLYFIGLNGLLGKSPEAGMAAEFKADLLAFGKAVASSSGGGFLGFGSKISKEEKAALESIEKMLGNFDAAVKAFADSAKP